MTEEERKNVINWFADIRAAMDCSNEDFSDLEKEFVESVYDQFTENKHLSEKQTGVLFKIWESI